MQRSSAQQIENNYGYQVAAMEAATRQKQLLDEGKKLAVWLGNTAKQALLEEVFTTPKPGLVDSYSNGAHWDMDIHSFVRSAEALELYFMQMAEIGYISAEEPDKIFAKLRLIGMEAEKAMYGATRNANTHKGLIFSMGILCAAAARCCRINGKITEDGLVEAEQQMVRKTLQQELELLQKNRNCDSHGSDLYLRYGITGVRGEAIEGYRSVREIGLPVMREGIQKNYDFNAVKLQVLLEFIATVEDSNVLFRTDWETFAYARNCVKQFLLQGGAYQKDAQEKLKRMDIDFSRKNISHGGCADLLALTIFLNRILEES